MPRCYTGRDDMMYMSEYSVPVHLNRPSDQIYGSSSCSFNFIYSVLHMEVGVVVFFRPERCIRVYHICVILLLIIRIHQFSWASERYMFYLVYFWFFSLLGAQFFSRIYSRYVCFIKYVFHP